MSDPTAKAKHLVELLTSAAKTLDVPKLMEEIAANLGVTPQEADTMRREFESRDVIHIRVDPAVNLAEGGPPGELARVWWVKGPRN